MNSPNSVTFTPRRPCPRNDELREQMIASGVLRPALDNVPPTPANPARVVLRIDQAGREAAATKFHRAGWCDDFKGNPWVERMEATRRRARTRAL